MALFSRTQESHKQHLGNHLENSMYKLIHRGAHISYKLKKISAVTLELCSEISMMVLTVLGGRVVVCQYLFI